METFGLALARLLRARKCSVSDWARQVGITQGYASNLILGRRNPPFDRGVVWAKRFKLTAGEHQDFLDLVALSHLPPPYRARLLRLKAENERLHWLIKRQRKPAAKAQRTVR
jgi:transcriptional regulator with XRE-family HTH domain